MTLVPLDQALRILREQGCGPNEAGGYICPRCRAGALTILANGAGPEYRCAGGCDAIGGYLATVATLAVPKGEHVDRLEVLRGKLKLPELQRIVKHGRMGSGYDLHLADGRIVVLGSMTILQSQAKFRAAFLPQVRRSPPRYKTADWDEVVELVEQSADERDTVSTLNDETLSWIAGAIADRPLRRNIDTANAATLYELLAPGANGRPAFIDTHLRLHLRLEHLTTWLGRMNGVRVTQPELSTRLSGLDFERALHQARCGEKVRKARYWVSPPGLEDQL